MNSTATASLKLFDDGDALKFLVWQKDVGAKLQQLGLFGAVEGKGAEGRIPKPERTEMIRRLRLSSDGREPNVFEVDAAMNKAWQAWHEAVFRETTRDVERDEKAIGVILGTLDTSLKSKYQSTSSPKVLWDVIESDSLRKNAVVQSRLESKFSGWKWDSSLGAAENIGNLELIVEACGKNGTKRSTQQILVMLMTSAGLPAKFEFLRNKTNSKLTDSSSFDDQGESKDSDLSWSYIKQQLYGVEQVEVKEPTSDGGRTSGPSAPPPKAPTDNHELTAPSTGLFSGLDTSHVYCPPYPWGMAFMGNSRGQFGGSFGGQPGFGAALALATESHEVASDLIVGVIAAEEDAAIAKGSRAEGDRRVHR